MATSPRITNSLFSAHYFSPFNLALLFVLMTIVTGSGQAQTFTVLHTFTGPDGYYPFAGVTIDVAGNLYGTTITSAYELKSSAEGYSFHLLFTFHGGNGGSTIESNILPGPGGAFYGTAYQGGFYSGGVVFSLRPQPTPCRTSACLWSENVAYPFHGVGSGDGNNPVYGSLAFDQAGNAYGTTSTHGQYHCGTAYKLSRSEGGWTETIIHQFGALGDGCQPMHNMISDASGNLYGTAEYGGLYGGGTVFELIPSGAGWTEKIIENFQPSVGDAGGNPIAGVIRDASGNLYGATSLSIAGGGAIFELSPNGNTWQLTTLHSFSSPNALGLIGNLAMDSNGNLYGNSIGFGAYGVGSVFKLQPTEEGWIFSSIYDFTGREDGSYPTGDLVIDANGNLYGTAQSTFLNPGDVWKITP